MKKIICLLFAGILMVSPLVLAQDAAVVPETQEPGMEHKMKDMEKGHGMHGMKKKWGKKGAMCAMCAMKSGGKQMVAVGDGIVVLVGNKLIKYDKNLNVVKEVQVKMDHEDMQGMHDCPMMGGEGEGGKDKVEDEAGQEEQH
jgi:hypothetical protein